MTTGVLSMSLPNLRHQQAIEQAWQSSLSQLSNGSVEILLPFAMRDVLGQDGLDAIVARYSALIRSHASVLHDSSSNSIRIFPPSGVQVGASGAQTPSMSASSASPAATANSEEISAGSPGETATCLDTSSPPARPAAIKSRVAKSRIAKVPRPPNAFILYRQHHHPLIKASKPNLHNNEISVILGNQWKNEDQDVKESYKIKAAEMKKKHFEDHPEYQYQPRKPSEKKRRMTKKKVADSSRAAASNVAPISLPSQSNAPLTTQSSSVVPLTPLQVLHEALEPASNTPPLDGVATSQLVPDFQTFQSGAFIIHDLYPTQTQLFGEMIDKYNASINHVHDPFADLELPWTLATDEVADDRVFWEAHIDYEALEQQVEAENATMKAEYDLAHACPATGSKAATTGALGVTLAGYDQNFERDMAEFTNAEDGRMEDLMLDFSGPSFEEAVAAQNFTGADFLQDGTYGSDFL